MEIDFWVPEHVLLCLFRWMVGFWCNSQLDFDLLSCILNWCKRILNVWFVLRWHCSWQELTRLAFNLVVQLFFIFSEAIQLCNFFSSDSGVVISACSIQGVQLVHQHLYVAVHLFAILQECVGSWGIPMAAVVMLISSFVLCGCVQNCRVLFLLRVAVEKIMADRQWRVWA